MEVKLKQQPLKLHDRQNAAASSDAEFLGPPDPRLAVAVVVPIYDEFSNGNVYQLLEDFVHQDADSQTFEVVFVVNNTPEDAQSKNAAFRDNQKTLSLAATSDTHKTPLKLPELVPAHFQALLGQIRRQAVKVHFLDRSSSGMERNIGMIRNHGILPIVRRFEAIGVDGFVANLDADTRIPRNYISQLVSFLRFPQVKVAYVHAVQRFQGAQEFLFANSFGLHLSHHYRAMCLNLFEPAQTFVGGPQITARARVWRELGGFPALTFGEDTGFSQAVRNMDGVVSIPSIAIEHQTRVREVGFGSYTLAKIVRQVQDGQIDPDARGGGRTPYFLLRIHFLACRLRRTFTVLVQHEGLNFNDWIRLRERIRRSDVRAEIVKIFERFRFQFEEQAWQTWLDIQVNLCGLKASDLTAYLIETNQNTAAALKANIEDFMHQVLLPQAPESYQLLRRMIHEKLCEVSLELDAFRAEIQRIVHTAYADSQDSYESRKNRLARSVRESSHPLIHMLTTEARSNIRTLPTLQTRLESTVCLPTPSAAFEHLQTLYPDWLHALPETPYRQDCTYLDVFARFVQLAKHMPSTFPGMHQILVETTGHQFTTYEE